MIYGDLSHEYFFIFNNRKIIGFKGLYDEKETKICVKAETYKIQKRSPTHQLICVRCQFQNVFSFSICLFLVLVFKSRRQTNGIYSLFKKKIKYK